LGQLHAYFLWGYSVSFFRHGSERGNGYIILEMKLMIVLRKQNTK